MGGFLLTGMFSHAVLRKPHIGMIEKFSLRVISWIIQVLPFFFICVVLLHSCIIIDVHGDLA